MPKPVSKPRKKVLGYKMPPPFPNGLIIEDIVKKKWKLGPSIGKGGFGEIYSAQDLNSTGKTYPYVVKIEPHTNGPLFVEMHFYMRAAKSADVSAFKTDKKLGTFGMPEYLGSGSHEHNGEKYRFLVMHQFGSDIWKIFLENKRCFPTDTVFKLGVQMLDVLEYIHSKGYIHGDIKGANILLGRDKEADKQVYLVDFGLCTHYSKVYKPDPKKAHNGTIEYLSRDAHLGVESRRGDLEILGYNLTQWLGCVLPWEKNLTDPVAVKNSKEKSMENLTDFFKICFKNSQPPAALVNYFKYILSLKFETNPDYKKMRQILQSGIEAAGGSTKSPLKFKATLITPLKRRKSKSLSPAKRHKVSVKKTNTVKENLSDDEVFTKITPIKKRSRRVADTQESEDEDPANSSSYGYTAEMLRIKNQLVAKKKSKPKINGDSSRELRKRTITISDNDSILSNGRNPDLSVQIISNSESEEEVILTKKKVVRKIK